MDGLTTCCPSTTTCSSAFWMTIKLAAFSAVGSLVLGTLIADRCASPRWRCFGPSAPDTSTPSATPRSPWSRSSARSDWATRCSIHLADPTLADLPRRQHVPARRPRPVGLPRLVRRRGTAQRHQHRAPGPGRGRPGDRPVLRAHPHQHRAPPGLPRRAIAPLGNTLIALTKNTTVVATIGVLEAADMMRGMLEFDISQLYWIFAIMATGFVVLTLPLGLLTTGPVEDAGGAAMSAAHCSVRRPRTEGTRASPV